VEVSQAPLDQIGPLVLENAARPLDYVLTHFTLQAAGPADAVAGRVELWLRFPAALWGMLTLAALRPLARRWLSGPAAWAAWAMMAAAPLAVQYSQELRPYALYLLLSVLSFYHLDCALGLGARPRRAPLLHWLAFAVVSAASTLTHFFYVFVLFAQAVFVGGLFAAEWWRSRRPGASGERRVGWRGLLACAGGAAAGVAALFVDFAPLHAGLYAADLLGALVHAPAAGGLVSDSGATVGVADVLNADFFLRAVLPFFGGGEGLALIVFGAAVLLGLAALARRDWTRGLEGVLWLLLAPGLVIIYLQYRSQFFALRYILFALPIYLMLAAAGLESLIRLAALLPFAARVETASLREGASDHNPNQAAFNAGRGWRLAGAALFGAGLALLLVFQLQRVALYYSLPKDDWRRVGQFLTLNARPGDTLGAPDVQAFIRFYAPHQAAVIVDANDLGPHQEALANGERFWFVDSTYTLLPVAETKQWAESLPAVTFQLDPVIKVIFVDPNATQAQMLAEAQQFVVPPSSTP